MPASGCPDPGRQPDFALDPLPDAVGPPLQIESVRPATVDEHLVHGGHGGPRILADHSRVHVRLAPTENFEALFDHDPFHLADAGLHQFGAIREEADAGGVATGARQVEGGGGPQETVRDLDEYPGAVPGVRIGALRSPMLLAAEGLEGQRDEPVGAPALQARYETDPAGVVLEFAPVQAGHQLPFINPDDDSPDKAREGADRSRSAARSMTSSGCRAETGMVYTRQARDGISRRPC